MATWARSGAGGNAGCGGAGGRSVPGAEAAGHAGAHGTAGDVQSSDLDVLAVVAVLLLHRVQRRNGRGVPQVGPGQVDDNVLGVLGVLELGVQIVGGGPEELTVDRVSGHGLI